MKTIAAILSIFMVSSASLFAQTKDEKIAHYLEIFSQLRTLAKQYQADTIRAQEKLRGGQGLEESSRAQQKIQSKIEQLVSEKLSSEQLFRVGTAAYLASLPGEAGADIPYDQVLALAFDHSAALLAKRGDHDAASYLPIMQRMCSHDASESAWFKDLIKQQNSLRLRMQ